MEKRTIRFFGFTVAHIQMNQAILQYDMNAKCKCSNLFFFFILLNISLESNSEIISYSPLDCNVARLMI